MHFSPGAACRGNFVPYSEKRDRVFYLIFTSPDAFFKFSTKSGHVRRRPKLTFEKLNINSVFPFFFGAICLTSDCAIGGPLYGQARPSASAFSPYIYSYLCIFPNLKLYGLRLRLVVCHIVTFSHRRRQEQRFLEWFLGCLSMFFFFWILGGFCGCGHMSGLNMNSDMAGWAQLLNLMNGSGNI